MNIIIKEENDEFRVIFPYQKDAVQEIRNIKGAKWDRINKFWIVPLCEHAAVDRFRGKFFSIKTDADFDHTPRKKDGTINHTAPNAGDYYDC